MIDELLVKEDQDFDYQPPKVVHEHNGAWWFWDEAWDRMGPYVSESETTKAVNEYARNLYNSIS